MKQSAQQGSTFSGLHVALILDGNGRWATSRGLPRAAGHRAGAEAVRRVVDAAPGLGIGTLTLYAFSSDNWQRPAGEVASLMRIFQEFFAGELQGWVERGVRLTVLGRRERLWPMLRAVIEAAERATAGGERLHVRLALDYSSRDAILRAACRMYLATEISREAFTRLLTGTPTGAAPPPDVDLLIRTGGERRLSDFLLWESAYAELVFLDKMWPEFVVDDLAGALQQFAERDRRFGRVPEAAAS